MTLEAEPKPKPKPTVKYKNCSCVCISLCTTVVHNTELTVLIIFPFIFQKLIIAHVLSIGGKGDVISKH